MNLLLPDLPERYADDFTIEESAIALEPMATYGISDTTSDLWEFSESARIMAKEGDSDKAYRDTEMLSATENADIADNLAWIHFYYLRDKLKDGHSFGFKDNLAKYLKLRNRRPSLAHSVMLGLALKVCDREIFFDMFSFLKLWGPENFRSYDYNSYFKSGREIRPLVERLVVRLVREPFYRSYNDFRAFFRPDFLPDDALKLLFYTSFHKHICRLLRWQRYERMWQFQRLYLDFLRNDAPEGFDSLMLRAACEGTLNGCGKYIPWYMHEWNLANASDADFHPTTSAEGERIEPLVNTAMGRLFGEIAKSPSSYTSALTWVIATFETVANRQKVRFWTDFRRAWLLFWGCRIEEAYDVLLSIQPSMQSRAGYQELLDQLERKRKLD